MSDPAIRPILPDDIDQPTCEHVYYEEEPGRRSNGVIFNIPADHQPNAAQAIDKHNYLWPSGDDSVKAWRGVLSVYFA